MGTYNRSDLDAVIKAYDVRGVADEGIDADLVGVIGIAFGHIMRSEDVTCAVVGHDIRESSPKLAASFVDGAAARGFNVTLLGLTSMNELHFVFGVEGCLDAMFVVNHSPAEYDDVKMCRSLARPIGQETGSAQIKDLPADRTPEYTGTPSEIDHEDILQDYAAFPHGLVDICSDRHLKVAVDAGNGIEGLTVPAVLGEDTGVADFYFEFDSNFPNHEASPLELANLVDLQKFAVEQGTDIGTTLDGDADRCLVVDEKGNPASPSAICALVATRYLEQNPGAAIIHNLITSYVVPKMIMGNGGTPIHAHIGRSLIKAQMAEHSTVFGGEHPVRYYFKEPFNVDSGILAAMYVLAALAKQDKPLSEFMARCSRYETSGEANSRLGSTEEQQAE